MTNFEFSVPVKIVFGKGKINEVGHYCKDYGKKALIACDPFCVESGLTTKLISALHEAGITSEIFAEIIPNPTCGLIDKGSELAENCDCDFVIGLGGGSSMDSAKGIAVGATHEGSIWDYAIGDKEISNKVLPIVAISTTSGTGSQCTCFSVITNPETNQKPGMGSPYILPSLALVDPELMMTLPRQLTLNTGFDVLSHAIEAYTSKASSPMSDMYAEKAIELVAHNLPICYHDGHHIDARGAMAVADTYAGIAICHAVVSLGHVMAHVISGHYHDIPHGDALFSIYKEVLHHNSNGMPEKHRKIANLLVPGSDDVVSAFSQFVGQFEFENHLKMKDLTDDAMRTLATDTFTYMKGIIDLNPAEATVEDAYRILKDSLH